MVVGGAVDRLSAVRKLASRVAGALGGGNTLHGGVVLWSSLRWRGGLLLRTRSSWWRPIFVEVAVGARIIHEDIHQDGKLGPRVGAPARTQVDQSMEMLQQMGT